MLQTRRCRNSTVERILFSIIIILTMTLLVACSAEQSGYLAPSEVPVGTVSSSIESVDIAIDNYKRAAQLWQSVKAFHFVRTTTVTANNTQIVSGDITLPDKVFLINGIKENDLQVILIGSSSWQRYSSGKWLPANWTLDAISSVVPIHLMNDLSRATVQNDLGDNVLDGAQVHHFLVTVANLRQPMYSEVWIDKHTGYLQQVKTHIALTDSGAVESEQIVRLSRFNDPQILITPPLK